MNEFQVENTVQPITDDFSSDGTLDDFARVDHQHPLSESLRQRLGLSSGSYNKGAIAGRNLLDNGQMKVSQRLPNDQYTTAPIQTWYTDRWQYLHQEVVAAFYYGSYYYGWTGKGTSVTCLRVGNTATKAIAAGEYEVLRQGIAGNRLYELLWGTANAKSVTATLTLWVSRSVTIILNLVCGAYRINSPINLIAGWQTVTITFPGLTAFAPNVGSNSAELYFDIWFAAGSTYNTGNVADLLGKNWSNVATSVQIASGCTDIWSVAGTGLYISEAQLEMGSVATPVENISFADTLEQCQRYYEHSYYYGVIPGTSTGTGVSTAKIFDTTILTRFVITHGTFQVRKRITPTISTWSVDGTAGNISLYNNNAVRLVVAGINGVSDRQIGYYLDTTANGVANTLYLFHWAASAEI